MSKAKLVLRPSGYNPGKPWALQLLVEFTAGSPRIQLLTWVSHKEAELILEAGAAMRLDTLGEPVGLAAEKEEGV